MVLNILSTASQIRVAAVSLPDCVIVVERHNDAQLLCAAGAPPFLLDMMLSDMREQVRTPFKRTPGAQLALVAREDFSCCVLQSAHVRGHLPGQARS